MKEVKVVLFGFILHCIFLLSVFDIYFKSPIVKNIPIQFSHMAPPAKRLVLFVADGLRADSIFSMENDKYLSSYLRSIIQNRGVWGVAHARVPTESRPGHIALIAGFYEDPSAVFTGWKDNLVEFDSLFNQSYVTYSWGSPDILHMFKKGAVENKVNTFCYDAEDEDFSGHGSTKLNTWVFDEVDKFIRSAKETIALHNSLNQQGIVLFLHLLGTDVAGHSNKPHSRQYKDNINVIDEGVRRIETLLNEFYNNDNKTAFVYTSDHGMTDWGSHGAGSASETEVPLIAWGAGLTSPQVAETPHPDTPDRWGLGQLLRRDVAQADICPLMATLIGTPIPVHSVGVLPLDYLSLTDRDKAEALLLNAHQLTAQFTSKKMAIEATLMDCFYRPFLELTNDQEININQNISQLIKEEKFQEAIEETKRLIQLTHSGLDYYHSYFQGLLLTCVSLSFLGWIAWLLCLLLRQSQDKRKRDYSSEHSKKVVTLQFLMDVTFLFLACATIGLIFIQSMPLQFYLYCCLPQLIWWAVFRSCPSVTNFTEFKYLHVFGASALCILLLELLVLTFFERWVLSLVVAVIGFWPLLLGERKKLVPTRTLWYWLGSFLALAVFPSLPVVGHQTQSEYVILCGGLWVMLGVASLYVLGPSKMGWTIPLQLLMLALAAAVVLSSSYDFERGRGLQSVNQVAAWTLLVSSVTMPLMTDIGVPSRLLSIGLGLACPFLLLCVGHEAFFLIALFLNLCVWLVVEAFLSKVEVMTIKFEETPRINQELSADDFRKGFFFLTYVILSFFGTGNIASVNSFDVSWVRCFLTVFSPFTMMSLILLKTMVPFLLVTCAFRAVNVFSQVKAEKMFIIVLIYCDIMGLHFLFAVKNKGSWLEIGTSVSHFVIMEVTVLFLAVLYYIARLYTGAALSKTSTTTTDSPIAPIWVTTHKKHPD